MFAELDLQIQSLERALGYSSTEYRGIDGEENVPSYYSTLTRLEKILENVSYSACKLDDNNGRPIYETAQTSSTPLELGQRGGVYFNSTTRNGRPYKRYPKCKFQENWPAVRHALLTRLNPVHVQIRREIEEQRIYDANILGVHFPPLLERLSLFKGAGGRLLFQPIAERIEALDDDAKIALVPWLRKNRCVLAKNIKDAFSNHPSLQKDKLELDAIVLGMENHSVQLDFIRGDDPTQCPRLVGPVNESERIDMMDGEEFDPSQTVMVRFSEVADIHVDRHACIPWQTLSEYVQGKNPITHGTVSRMHEGGDDMEEYETTNERGPPVAAVLDLFPMNNNRLAADPFVTPLLRMQRLLRL